MNGESGDEEFEELGELFSDNATDEEFQVDFEECNSSDSEEEVSLKIWPNKKNSHQGYFFVRSLSLWNIDIKSNCIASYYRSKSI